MQEEEGPSEAPPEPVKIVIDRLPAHKEFVDSFVEELEKANTWYEAKLVELKVTFSVPRSSVFERCPCRNNEN